MFACMRIACGGEDIEKNIYEREREMVYYSHSRLYTVSFQRVCVCVCLSLLWSCHTTCLSKIVL
jgi:hypothetical protein